MVVTLTVGVDAPEWDGYASASPGEQAQWDSYSINLKDHEEGHVEIATKGATEVGNAVQGSTATGIGKTRRAAGDNAVTNVQKVQQQNFTNADKKVAQQQTDFDTKTQHGKIPRKDLQ